ncbi:S-adenosyl-L-methionine-dependent methyltransferase [Xylariaceae sp. FL0016]|nr:S-adenosyl-L-methionine-dependent methyltransferase [Xylariaceae sp. FL0016]
MSSPPAASKSTDTPARLPPTPQEAGRADAVTDTEAACVSTPAATPTHAPAPDSTATGTHAAANAPNPTAPSSGTATVAEYPMSSSIIEPASGTRDDYNDDDLATEDWDESVSNASTSITSSIYQHTYENGRRYHKYKHGRYPIPNDDMEQNREDMKHAMMMELTDGKLFFSPIGDYPNKILDLGTGTGIWAIEVGDQYPSAEVLGLDLSPIQPVWIPPNVKFLIDDCEDEWLNGHGWDLVHLRSMSPIIKDNARLCRQTFEHLRPGGWMEWHEQHAVFCCDDGTMPPDDPCVQFYELAHQAFAKMGFDIHTSAAMREPMEAAGFTNVHCIVKKVPVGPWAADKTLRLVGLYMRIIIQEFAPALAGKPFQILGLSEVEREAWKVKVVKALNDMTRHRYWNIYFWYGQKPLA